MDEFQNGFDSTKNSLFFLTVIGSSEYYTASESSSAFLTDGALLSIGERSIVLHSVIEIYSCATFKVNESKIVLTSTARQIGSVWHRSPLDVANWEVELEFNIPDKWLKGDGFGFLYTEKPEHGRAYGAALNFTGLVVAVDTYQNYLNEIYPCPLTVQIFNGSQTLDLWADGVDTAVVAHPVVLSGRENLPVTMKIRYQDYALTVSLTVSGESGDNVCSSS